MKLKYHILSLLFLAMISKTKAQRVGIGTTTPHTSSILDVTATDKGILLPRVNLTGLTDNTTIASPAISLMVYNYANAGTAPNAILGHRVYVWRGTFWDAFSNLPEIKTLKVPIDFARVSKVDDIFSAAQLSNVNASGVIPIQWNSSDVVVVNTNDIEADNSPNTKILTTSNYQLSGMFTFRINTITTNTPTNFVITLQKSSNSGGSWTNVAATAIPLENKAVAQIQSAVFPNVVLHFSANDLIRFVVSRPAGVSGTNAGDYQANSGLFTRLANDVTRSIRITRLTE